jgi:Holliday junction resolvase-like predicted endonuclease
MVGMNPTDLAWVAGLLEGEGSFMAGPPSHPNQPGIVIEMTDLDVLQRLARILGVTRIKIRKTGWKQSWRVLVRSRKAADLMRLLRPWMGSRRQAQIDHALQNYNQSQSDLRQLVLPPINELRHLNRSHSMRELGKMFGCSQTKIYRALHKAA